jgi:hypothetical protein
MLDPFRARGERHGSARLTEAQILEAARLSIEGLTTRQLATRYGVSSSTIVRALNGTRWQHLAPQLRKVRRETRATDTPVLPLVGTPVSTRANFPAAQTPLAPARACRGGAERNRGAGAAGRPALFDLLVLMLLTSSGS